MIDNDRRDVDAGRRDLASREEDSHADRQQVSEPSDARAQGDRNQNERWESEGGALASPLRSGKVAERSAPCDAGSSPSHCSPTR